MAGENEEASSLGVPKADFIANVDEYMKAPNREATEKVLRNFEEMIQRYKIVETNLMQRRSRLRTKVDDLKQSIKLIAAMKARQKGEKTVQTMFMLSEQCYASADVPATDRICLWLGANVMVEYTSDEAGTFLSKELVSCEEKIKELSSNLGMIRNQVTTSEVNMARVYNWDVQKRKKAAAAQS